MSPRGIAVNNTHLYVSDYDNYRIVVFNLSGELIKTFGTKGNGDGQLNSVFGIALTSDRLIVADYSNNRVQWFQ